MQWGIGDETTKAQSAGQNKSLLLVLFKNQSYMRTLSKADPYVKELVNFRICENNDLEMFSHKEKNKTLVPWGENLKPCLFLKLFEEFLRQGIVMFVLKPWKA